jgi:hypothetical protein
LGFQVERRSGAGAWALLATTESNTTGYSDAGLSEAITFSYRVQTFNTAGNSTYSNEASATTLILVIATAGANGSISPASQHGRPRRHHHLHRHPRHQLHRQRHRLRR